MSLLVTAFIVCSSLALLTTIQKNRNGVGQWAWYFNSIASRSVMATSGKDIWEAATQLLLGLGTSLNPSPGGHHCLICLCHIPWSTATSTVMTGCWELHQVQRKMFWVPGLLQDSVIPQRQEWSLTGWNKWGREPGLLGSKTGSTTCLWDIGRIVFHIYLCLSFPLLKQGWKFPSHVLFWQILRLRLPFWDIQSPFMSVQINETWVALIPNQLSKIKTMNVEQYQCIGS